MTPNPLPDDALALRAKLVAALHGHTKYSRDVTLTGEWLTEQIWPVITPFISRLEAAEERAERAEAAAFNEALLTRDLMAKLEAAEARAAAAEAERDALRAALDVLSMALSMPGGPSLAVQRHDPSWEAWKQLCDTLGHTAPAISIRAALTANPKDTETILPARLAGETTAIRSGQIDPAKP